MVVRTEWVSFGPPAAEALRREIAAGKAGDPLAPVTVVVPTNQVGVATRRLLASGVLGPACEGAKGIAAVSFLTVYRMGELLGAARLAGAGRRPVSTPVIGAALRFALAEDPGIFGPVANHPATETALVSAYRELRDLSPEALRALAGQSARAADVVRLHREARRRLEAAWYDEKDLLDAGVEALQADPDIGRGLGTVVVYLPEQITRHGGRLLRAVADQAPLVVVAPTSGDARADADTVRSVRRLGGSPDAPAGGRQTWDVVEATRTRVVTVSDGDEEVRAGLRAVIEAVRDGSPLDRIALLFAEPEPYARLAHEQLTAAGVVVNGTSTMPLTARVAGRTLLGLLSLPENGFRREAVFAWLAGARVHRDRRWVATAAWERLSRDAGVVGERKDWDQRLERLATEFEAQAELDAENPDTPDWRAERARTSALRARELREFVLALVDDLSAAAAAPRTWPVWARWARGHLDRLLGGEAVRSGCPLVEQRAAERVDRAVDRLACLGEIEGPVALDVFTRTLELELEADLWRIGRMGQGVFVGPISMGVALDLDLVVVVGLAEGIFPARARDDSLLPDHERQAAGDELPLRASLVEKHHREFLATLASARRQLLCVPRGDLRGGRERVPSRWVLEAAKALAGKPMYSEDLLDPHSSEPWLQHVASFDAGLRAVAFPASDQEYRLRARLAGAEEAGGTPPDPVYAAGSAAVGERRSRRFTRFDGNVAGLAVPSPAEHVVSATRLERWAACPFAYLVGEVLGVEEVENPEEELTITPLNRGSLIHEILEEFVAEVLARPVERRPAPSDPWTAGDRDRLRMIAERHFEEYEAKGLTGRPVFWQRERRRIVADLMRVLREDSQHRAETGTRPVAAELEFGLRGSTVGTVAISIPDGRSVAFRGKADRVDIGDDGTLHVVDYKSGRATNYAGLSSDNPDLRGTKLQLPVYGQAARALLDAWGSPVLAEYWFTSARGEFKRIGYPVTEDVLEQFGRTLGVIVAGIEAGVFPLSPTVSSTAPWAECSYCDPDGLGVVDLRRAWERKIDDPALVPFAALLPPGDDRVDDD